MCCYLETIEKLAKSIPKNVANLSLPRERAHRPTQAFSDFAIHREQGDWAERLIMRSLQEVLTDYCVIKYGRTDDIMAGEPDFKKFFDRYQEELEKIGKRPDLLLFRKSDYPKDLSEDICMREDVVTLGDVISKAIAGFEVRSSSYLSRKYENSVEKEEKKGKRRFLSYTVKVEDLIVVLKWIRKYNVPHFYIQVFFDAAYILPFHKILEIIADEENEKKVFTIERNEKNQRKTTIHIDLKQGLCLGDTVIPPEHYSAMKELKRGKLLHYVKFKGAKLQINLDNLLSSIKVAEQFSNI